MQENEPVVVSTIRRECTILIYNGKLVEQNAQVVALLWLRIVASVRSSFLEE